MTGEMRNKIHEKGFQAILNITACSLEDRDFLTWLMNRFNLETMTLEISGGEKLRSLNTQSNACLTCLVKATIIRSYLTAQPSKLSWMLQHEYSQMSQSQRV
jgi:hypothetical protein